MSSGPSDSVQIKLTSRNYPLLRKWETIQ